MFWTLSISLLRSEIFIVSSALVSHFKNNRHINHVIMFPSYANGLSGLPTQQKTFEYNPNFGFQNLGIDYTTNAAPSQALDKQPSRKDLRKRSKKEKKRRSKLAKKDSKSRIAAYILQLLGFFCLVLAAVKSFEPLTGVGLTLILIGYKRIDSGAEVGKSSLLSTSLGIQADVEADLSKGIKQERIHKDGSKKTERIPDDVGKEKLDLDLEDEWVLISEDLLVEV